MDQDNLRKFLSAISMMESSGGRNTEHQRLRRGLHAGDAAVGNYGLMPNTIKEMAVRMKMEGIKDRKLASATKNENEDVEQSFKNNPELQERVAEYMAKKQLEKYPNLEQSIYSWKFGHNLPEEKMPLEKVSEDPYVKQVKKFYEDEERKDRFNKLQNLIDDSR